MNVDKRLFGIADFIAETHLPPKFFGWRRRLIDKIRLRQAIYNALIDAAGEEENGR